MHTQVLTNRRGGNSADTRESTASLWCMLTGLSTTGKDVTYQDNTHGYILAIHEFKHAPGINTIKALEEALSVAKPVNGVILVITLMEEALEHWVREYKHVCCIFLKRVERCQYNIRFRLETPAKNIRILQQSSLTVTFIKLIYDLYKV